MDRAEPERGRANAPRIVFGLFLLVLGSLFLLEQTGGFDVWEYTRYWPVFLVAFGLAKMTQPEGRVFGLVLTVVGTWLLLDALDLLEFEWNYLWPVLLILLGGSLVWRGLRAGGPGGRGTMDAGSRLSAFAMLGGVERKYASPSFRGGEATAIMGGCELDFSQAVPAKEGAVIDAFALWGGIDIKVPEDWTVDVRGTALLGGFEDSRRHPQPDPAKVLTVKGMAIMGGVEVKN